jgi:hypothetical protein
VLQFILTRSITAMFVLPYVSLSTFIGDGRLMTDSPAAAAAGGGERGPLEEAGRVGQQVHGLRAGGGGGGGAPLVTKGLSNGCSNRPLQRLQVCGSANGTPLMDRHLP